MKTSNKKGQEEIVGFLLIVVIVIVMGVVFLFLLKPRAETEQKDPQLDNLLSSMIGTTVDGVSIGDMIQNCEKGDGCDVLGSDLDNMTDTVFSKTGLVIGRNLAGYNLTISQGMSYSRAEGNATFRSIAALTVVRNSLVKLKFYY